VNPADTIIRSIGDIGGVRAVKVVKRLRNSYKINAAKTAAKKIAWRGLSPAISACRRILAPGYRRILLPGKLHRCPVVRVHFGCGTIADPRFINVDARIFSHVHYVTRSPLMPALPASSADMIYACHVFEHISHRTQASVLSRWHEILKPGGQLLLSVPDFDKVVGVYSRGERGFNWMQHVLMGGQHYSGEFHFALFNQARLGGLLLQAGFSNVREWHPRDEDNWPRDWSWDDELSLNLRADAAPPHARPADR
jgi:predicted SAM-dependent methyltransferase